MSKDKNSDKNNDEMAGNDADILRANDIIPPFNKKPADKQLDPIPIKAIPPKRPIPLELEKLYQGGPSKKPKARIDIPKFNLAEEILAEQRKITAIKRKAPSQKIETAPQTHKAEQTDSIGWSMPELTQHDQVVAEIVARDIKRLCRGTR